MYRDPLEGVRSRVRDLDASILTLEARFTPAYHQHLPADRAARLSSFRDAAQAVRGSDLAALRATEQVLTDYRDALEEAIAFAPELFAWLDAFPDAPAELEPLGNPNLGAMDRVVAGAFVEEKMTEMERQLQGALKALGVSAPLTRLGQLASRARLQIKGVPFALAADLNFRGNYNIDPVLRLSTTVRRGLPRTDLSPEMWRHAFCKALGLRRDRATGDFSFDSRFLVDVAEEAELDFLDGDVRAALLRLAYYDVPSLRIDAGQALLQWSFDPEEGPVRAAVDVLTALRRAQVSLTLTHGE